MSATAVLIPWMPVPPVGFDPTKETLQPVSTVPQGWTDSPVNGDPQLHNPQNSFVVRGGFRQIVLNWSGGWEVWNVPLENEHVTSQLEQSNKNLGPGVEQLFEDRRLEMLYNQGNKVIEGWLGQELEWYIQQYASTQSQLASVQSQLAAETQKDATDAANLAAAQQTISQLQAQIQQLQQAQGVPASLQQAVDAAVQALQPFVK